MNLREEKGYTMVVVIVTVVILSIMVTAVTTMALADIRKGKLWQDRTSAFYLAESGINEMLYKIIEEGAYFEDRDFILDSENPSLQSFRDYGPGNSFKVWAKKNNVTGTLRITSKGTSNKISKVVEAEIILPTIFPFEVVETHGPANVNQIPIYYLNTYNAPVLAVNIPEGPAYVPYQPAITTITGDVYYSSLTIGNGDTLRINGPANIYISGSALFNQNSKIIVNGDVNFQIAGDLTFENNSIFEIANGQAKWYIGRNATFNGKYIGNKIGMVEGNPVSSQRDPTKLLVYLASAQSPPQQEFYLDSHNNTVPRFTTIHNQCEFVGGIYAPSAIVNINQTQNSYLGAVVAWELLSDQLGSVTYDPRMATISLPNAGTWSIVGWSEQ